MSTVEAADILADYDQANNKANASFDVTGLARFETAPLRLASEAELQVSKLLDQPIPLITSTDPRFTIPAGPGPRWFMASSTRLQGDVVATSQTYILFRQQKPGSSWQAAYALTPDGVSVPTAALNGASAATEVTDFGDLVMRPDDLAPRIFDHYSKGLTGKDHFGPTPALDDQLGNGYKVATQVLRDQGTRLTRTPGPKVPATVALRTVDGGALVFSTSTVVDMLTPMQGTGTVSLRGGGNEAALLGSRRGATAAQFVVTRQQSFLTHIPTKESGRPVLVLAFTDFPVNVCRESQNRRLRCAK